MTAKDILRKELRNMAKRQGKTAEGEDQASRKALRTDSIFLQATCILAFHPLFDEVDITAILHEEAVKNRIALPICHADGSMTFHRIPETWKNESTKSNLGIQEPSQTCPQVVPDETMLILVPAMAYTKDGKRLGRGKGFYDRYLERYPKARTLGICRSWQLLDAIPVTPLDRKVERVLCAGTFYG